MVRIDLKDGPGPYVASVPNTDGTRRDVRYLVRAFGVDQLAPPNVIIVTDIPPNKPRDLEMGAEAIASRLVQAFELPNLDDSGDKLHILLHYPENAHGLHDERYIRASFVYDQTRPGEDARLHLHWRTHEPEAVWTRERVIGQIGAEAFYSSRNPLVHQAFEAGLDPTIDPKPGIDLD